MKRLPEEKKAVIKGKLVGVSKVPFAATPFSSLKRRSRVINIYRVLSLIHRSDRILKTHILYKENLSFQQLKEILQQLKKQGLVRAVKKGKKTYFRLTKKGLIAVGTGMEFFKLIGEP